MNVVRKSHLLAAMALFVAPMCYGATMSGTVKGPDGAPVAGAFVEAQNSKTKITNIGVSDAQGHYRVDKMPAGEYRVQIRAVGYSFTPQTGVKVTADQNLSSDLALAKGTVHWNDLSIYQLGMLTPASAGKELLFRKCFICHGFQTRMASVRRDGDGWRDRVEYMRTAMHFNFGTNFDDEQANTIATYLTSLFGPDSTLPSSPADLPKYKDTLRKDSAPKAYNIAFVEYDMPGPSRMPFSAAPAKDGSLWIPDFGVANKITKLDANTGEMKDYPVPNTGTAAVHSAFPGPDGSVWLAEQGSDKIGKWDPKTQQVTEYQDTYVPGKEGLAAFGEKHTVRVDHQGNVWATGYPLTKFDPETGKFTHYDKVPHLYGIDVDQEGNVWFTKHDTSQIGKVDAKTQEVTIYTPTNHNVPLYGVQSDKDGSVRSYPRRIAVAPDGMIWFGEFNAGYMGKFDPKTEKFTDYALPGPEPTPYAIGFDAAGQLWYSSYNQDVLGRMDTTTGKVTEYPFPHSENTMRELFLDKQGRMWYGSPANNKVGYFYLTGEGSKGTSGN